MEVKVKRDKQDQQVQVDQQVTQEQMEIKVKRGKLEQLVMLDQKVKRVK